MAGTTVSKAQHVTPVSLAYEVLDVVFGAGDTTTVITPTTIKAIHYVSIIPTNAAAATGATGTYLSTAVFGSGAWTLTSVNNATFKAVVYGQVA